MPRDLIREVLERSKTIAVVGCSRFPRKDAHQIPAFLQERGYRIIPVNPHAKEILGQTCYPDLKHAAAALDDPIDVVEVFRPSEEAPEVAREAAEVGARTLWLQLGIRSPEAEKIAREAGMDFVQDHCMKPEYNRRFDARSRSEIRKP